MDNQLKTCKNCKLFLLHYVKTDRGFIATAYGHCVNRKLNLYQNSACKACNYWQEKSEEKQQPDFKKALYKIANELKNIAKTIKD